jgi:hypothetical protein
VRAILREPLLHFIVGGALLFSVYQHETPPPRPTANREIVVTEAQLATFRRELAQVNQRPATDDELNAAIADYVDSEVLYREALALGLDAGDIVVRRRLEQKMRFLIEDTAGLPPPTDAELDAYLESHRAEYDEPERIRLSHVFLSRDRHGDRTEDLANALRARLQKRAATPDQVRDEGDAFAAGFDLNLMSERELVRYFGPEFAANVMRLSLASWSEPIASIHGVHLVWLRERVPERRVSLDEVRDRVRYAFEQGRMQAANAARLAELRAHYTIELPSLEAARAE